MPATGSLEPFSLKPCLLKALLLLLLCAPVLAETTKSFWTDCSTEFARESWRVYKPSAPGLASQGYLVMTTLDQPFAELKPQAVLGELYGRVDQLQVMGQKTMTVDGREITVMSFRGTKDDHPLIGRAAFSADGDKTQLMMLVRHSKASGELLNEFEHLIEQGPQSLPAAP